MYKGGGGVQNWARDASRKDPSFKHTVKVK